MAGKITEMSKIKQMLLLKESGQSNRQAAKELGMDTDASRGFSPSTVAGQNAGEYIRHGMTVIITGATGTGKSYLACALITGICERI